jgi:hypothetical protein
MEQEMGEFSFSPRLEEAATTLLEPAIEGESFDSSSSDSPEAARHLSARRATRGNAGMSSSRRRPRG